MDVTDKNSAIQMIDQLMSQYGLNNKDVIQRTISTNLNNKFVTKISIITVDDALFKFIIPLNSSNIWNNDCKQYMSDTGNYRDNKWYMAWYGDWGAVKVKKLQNFLVKTWRSRSECGFLPEYNDDNYENRPSSPVYQDNNTSKVEIRVRDLGVGYYNEQCTKVGAFGGRNRYSIYKTVVQPSYNGFLPIITVLEN